jgi:hypothetical protein
MRHSGIGQITVVITIDLFILQGLDKALRHGVVIGIARAAHAALDMMLAQQIAIVGTFSIAIWPILRSNSAIRCCSLVEISSRAAGPGRETLRHLGRATRLAISPAAWD